MKSLVTIGLQTFNRADTYLKSTLDSILIQTYKNFELIISDNASTDDTEKICREYERRDSRVKYIRQKENIGYVAHVNFLRTQGKGDYFLGACDDDLFEPTFLEKCIFLLDSHPEAVLAATNFVEFVDGKGQTPPHNPKEFFPSERDLYKRLKQYTLFYESDGKEMFFYCGVWRREIVKNDFFIDYFNKKFPWNWDFQDMNFVFRGLTQGTFEFVDEVLFKKRARDNSFDSPKTKSFPKRIFDSLAFSRLRRLITPFFYKRMGQIIRIKKLSVFARVKLLFWTLFVMSRLFWRRKI